MSAPVSGEGEAKWWERLEEAFLTNENATEGDDVNPMLALAVPYWEELDQVAEGCDPNSELLDRCAESARFAYLVARYSDGADADLWHARCLSAAARGGNFRTLALALQPIFFDLIEFRDFDGAESVLDEMDRLGTSTMTSSEERYPQAGLVEEILSERRALLLTFRGAACREASKWETCPGSQDQWSTGETPPRCSEGVCALAAAGQLLEEATEPLDEKKRRALKMNGLRIVTRWLRGGIESSEAAKQLKAIENALEEIGSRRLAAFAQLNVEAADRDDKSSWAPFEGV